MRSRSVQIGFLGVCCLSFLSQYAFALQELSEQRNVEVVEKEIPEDDEYPKRRIKGSFVDGKLHGEFVTYDMTGKRLAVESYVDGVQQGKMILYYPNGKVYAEADFVDGEMQGEKKQYYPDGTLRSKVKFVQGKAHGKSEIFFMNGKLRGTLTLKKGVPQGEQRGYTKTGRLAFVCKVEDGEQVDFQELISTLGPENDYSDLCSKYDRPLVDFWKNTKLMAMPENKEAYPTIFDSYNR